MTIKNTVAALAIAAVAGTMMLGTAGTAEAGGKKKRFHFHGFHGHHKVWHGPSCHRLKKKALRTGKRYWWKKYYRCMEYYY